MSPHQAQAPALALNAMRLTVMTMDPKEEDLCEIVRDTGLTVSDFLNGDGFLSWDELHQLTLNILRISPNPGLSLQAGMRGVPSIHGSMGIAAIAARI